MFNSLGIKIKSINKKILRVKVLIDFLEFTKKLKVFKFCFILSSSTNANFFSAKIAENSDASKVHFFPFLFKTFFLILQSLCI